MEEVELVELKYSSKSLIICKINNILLWTVEKLT